MDRDDFSLAPVFFARAYCPFCRREHEWFAQEAWVCDNPAPRAQALGAQALGAQALADAES